MKQNYVEELNHGDHIECVLLAIEDEKTDGKKRKRLVFYPTAGGERTITQFIFENSPSASVVRQMWARNLARQAGLNEDLPSEDKLKYVDGMKRDEAQKHINDKADKLLEQIKEAGTIVKLWMYRENGYVNYVPYEKPSQTETSVNADDVSF